MTIKPTKEPDTIPTDFWKHALVRKDCLVEAVKFNRGDPVELADRMYRFVIGEAVIKTLPTIDELEAILNSKPDTDVKVNIDGSITLSKQKEWK